MQAQMLLPFIGETAGNLKAIKSDKQTTEGIAEPGFAIILQSASQMVQKSSPDIVVTVNHEGGNLPGGIILPLLETNGAAKDPGLPLEVDDIMPEMSDDALTGLFALQPVRPELTNGEVQTQGAYINNGTAEPDPGIIAGLNGGETPENEKTLPVPSHNSQDFRGAPRETNRETTNGAVWKPNWSTETANRQGQDQIWRGEDPGSSHPTGGGKARLPSSGGSEVWQPQQLIAAEMEKHHGVKVSMPARNDGIMTETPQQSPINLTPNEITVLEKAPVPQEKVSTQDIINQVVRKIELFTGPKTNAVSIKLEPEFLGRLQINLEVVDDVLIARFSTDNLQVKQLLESGIGQLRSQLEASGIRLERAEVNIDLGHQFGEYQNPNESGYQNRQHVPYEATPYYSEAPIGDSIAQDMGGSSPEAGELHEGTVDYLI